MENNNNGKAELINPIEGLRQMAENMENKGKEIKQIIDESLQKYQEHLINICETLDKIVDTTYEEQERKCVFVIQKIAENNIGIVNEEYVYADHLVVLHDWIMNDCQGDWSQIPDIETLTANRIILKRPLSIEILTHPFTLKCVEYYIEHLDKYDVKRQDYDDYYYHYNYYQDTDNPVIKDVQNRINERFRQIKQE